MVFFEKSFEKTQIFRVFHLSSLISQNRDQIQGFVYYTSVSWATFLLKNDVNLFSDCAFWAKNG